MAHEKSEDKARETILVPLDGSAFAHRALELAKDLALQRHAQVTLLQVVATGKELAENQDTLAESQEFFQTHSVDCEYKTRLGEADDIIVEESQDADLIVMSSHGHSKFNRLILGSTAEKVIRKSACDVLVLRERQPRLKDIRKIMVPLDGHWLSHQALPKASDMCSSLGATLVLARVHDADKLTRNLSPGKEETAEQQKYLEKVGSEVGTDIQVETVQEVGNIARGLMKIAEKEDVDLVVMTSHGRGGFNRWVCGSVTESLLRTSTTPVLVVRATAASS